LAKEHSAPTGLRAGFGFRLGHSLSCGPYWLAVSSSALGLYVRVYLAHFPGLTSFLVHLALWAWCPSRVHVAFGISSSTTGPPPRSPWQKNKYTGGTAPRPYLARSSYEKPPAPLKPGLVWFSVRGTWEKAPASAAMAGENAKSRRMTQKGPGAGSAGVRKWGWACEIQTMTLEGTANQQGPRERTNQSAASRVYKSPSLTLSRPSHPQRVCSSQEQPEKLLLSPALWTRYILLSARSSTASAISLLFILWKPVSQKANGAPKASKSECL
jgi:hypothetical protein